MKRIYLDETKNLESAPKIVNIFSEKEIKMIQELYANLPEKIFNKKQNIRKKAWIQNYNKALDQIYFDKIGMPYTSSGAEKSELTFDKHKCNETLRELNFRCAVSYFYKKGETINADEITQKVGLPCFVKPNATGSSFGISKVMKKEDLEDAIQLALQHDNKVLIEEFIDGTEVSCGIFTHKEIEVFPLTEIVSHNDFFDFEAKYRGLSDEITPARISREATENVQKITKEVYQKLGLKGIVRIDYIIMKVKLYLIEINTIPGLSTESIIPKQAKQAGYKLSELFELTIENTLNK